MKNRPMLAAAVLVGIGVVIGVAVVSFFQSGGVDTLYAQAQRIGDLGAKQPPVKPESAALVLNNAFKAVSRAVEPSVVSINVVTERKLSQDERKFRDFFGFRSPNQPDDDEESFRSQGAGSGVFLTTDGYIITNNHVVAEAKKNGGIKVITHDKHEYDAKLVGRDELTDIAVIKIDAKSNETFKPAFLGNSDNVQIGELVIAVGNPLGLHSTITSGIVSAMGRGRLGLSRAERSIEHYIQTDAAINPGNSGGGLFDLEGKLIGINSAIATRTGGFQGYGFAIPTNLAKSVAADLMDDGKINRGYIGVTITAVSEADAKAAGLSKVTGAMIQGFSPNSAGKEAGLQEGDIILEVDGVEIASSNDLQSRIGMKRSGDKVSLLLWREQKKITKQVTLRAPEEKNNNVSDNVSPGASEEPDSKGKPITLDNFGITFEQLDEKSKQSFDVKSGVKVSKVEQYGVAYNAGISSGSVILKFAGQSVSSPQQLKDLFLSKKPGEAVMIQIKTPTGTRMLGIEIPRKDG